MVLFLEQKRWILVHLAVMKKSYKKWGHGTFRLLTNLKLYFFLTEQFREKILLLLRLRVEVSSTYEAFKTKIFF